MTLPPNDVHARASDFEEFESTVVSNSTTHERRGHVTHCAARNGNRTKLGSNSHGDLRLTGRPARDSVVSGGTLHLEVASKAAASNEYNKEDGNYQQLNPALCLRGVCSLLF